MIEYLDGPRGRLAYRRSTGAGPGPGVVFCGGFKSDMDGSKAVFLEDWAKAQGVAFLRFDYTGHGSSDGAFEDGCIGDWAADAALVIDAVTEGPQVIVGSSMGGWIALLRARAQPERVAGLVGIAAAPDFTEAMRAGFTAEQQVELARDGRVAQPSEYSDPYIITQHSLDDGAQNLIFDRPLALPFPTRLLLGTADTAVPVALATRLLDHAEGPDIRLTLVKGADHRFSNEACLALIAENIEAVLQAYAKTS